MNASSDRRYYSILYFTSALIFLTVGLRSYNQEQTPDGVIFLTIMLAGYLLVGIAEPFLTRRNRNFLYVYTLIQTAITFLLLVVLDNFDYYAMLVIPLGGLVIWQLPQKNAFYCVIFASLCTTAGLIIVFGWLQGLAYALAYLVAMTMLTSFVIIALNAIKSRQKSEALLVELQEAHQQLQVYASQVEELAAEQERNRLARELHDSVTQTIFSMTLTAQAARILLDRDASRVAGQLDHLQELAQSALSEMRTLIQQLRPRSIAEEGLVPALKRQVRERQAQDGLTVDLKVEGARRLPAEMEEALYRVVQEALNNVVKHAGTGQACVHLSLEGSSVWLEVSDRGAGFDHQQVHREPGHMGLASMAERVRGLGGELTIDSHPGQGTRIRVDHLQVEESQHDQ